MELTQQEHQMLEILRKQEIGRKKTGIFFICAGIVWFVAGIIGFNFIDQLVKKSETLFISFAFPMTLIAFILGGYFIGKGVAELKGNPARTLLLKLISEMLKQ